MLHVGVQVSVDVLTTVVRTTVAQLELLAENVSILQRPFSLTYSVPKPNILCFALSLFLSKEKKEKDGVAALLKGADEHEVVLTSLYLLVIVSKLIKRCRPEAAHTLCTLVYRMANSGCATNNGNTLLHLSVDSRTPVNDFHTRNVCHFPCANTAKYVSPLTLFHFGQLN